MSRHLLALIVCLGLLSSSVSDAAIYGENNLDDNPYKTQCEWPEGEDPPPVGLMARVRGGKLTPMGTGAVVSNSQIVLTVAHSFFWPQGIRVLPDDELYFLVYELNTSGECVRRRYSVKSWSIPSKNYWLPSDYHNDWAIVTLNDPIKNYTPYALASVKEVVEVKHESYLPGGVAVSLYGFGDHVAIRRGLYLAFVTGFLYGPGPLADDIATKGNIVAHDMDTANGMSGSPIISAETGNFVGMHIMTTTRAEVVEFDKNDTYSFGQLVTRDMRDMREAVDKAVNDLSPKNGRSKTKP